MKPSDSVKKSLDDQLDKLDATTVEKLRAIRRKAIDSASFETATGLEVHAHSNQLTASNYFFWQQKKWMLVGLVMSITLVLVLFNRPEPVVYLDGVMDLTLYSEVDPDWLIDMEIAEVFGDE